MESDTLTLQEAADLLGKSTQTVRRLIKKGGLQAQRIQTPQGFQYAVLRSSMTARFTRYPNVSNVPTVQPTPTTVDVHPVGTDWSPFLTSQNGTQKVEASNSPESFLENDYYILEPSPVPAPPAPIQETMDRNTVSSRQLLEFAQAAHKEKLMLITILERLQAELERERGRPKTALQWIGNALKSALSLFKKEN